ncbi:MAG: peptidoglycan DD-metalloendopeptidase family protein [Leptonema sp. (in: bacteria)]
MFCRIGSLRENNFGISNPILNHTKVFSKYSLFIFLFFFTTGLLQSQSEETDEIDLEIQKYIYKMRNNDVDEQKLKELEQELNQANQNKKFLNSENDEVKHKMIEFHNLNTSKYIVQPKDTLYSIAKKFNMNINQIYSLNPQLKNRGLYIGEEIQVVDLSTEQKELDWKIIKKEFFEGKTYTIKKGDTLSAIAKKFNTTVKELVKINNLRPNDRLKPNTKIYIDKFKIVKEYKVRNYFLKPVEGYITSTFGFRKNPFINNMNHFHKGIDIGADLGTPILAAKEGLVIYSGRMEGYGNCIFIRHQDGYITVYGHNKTNYVKTGDIVARGQKIGEVGRTGFATGPHLHFEIRKLDEPINPLLALQWEEKIELSLKRIALK